MIDTLPMTDCPALAVPAAVMQHVVRIESGHNPFAIGVVGDRLARQPRTLDEALATVRMLESKGYQYSLGLAQIYKGNLAKYGIDSYAKAFDRCTNLQAGARILAQCLNDASGHWGKAFSCYYSGNFKTGFRHGYVQKIYASMAREGQTVVEPSEIDATQPIPTVREERAGDHRIALRSLPILPPAQPPPASVAAPSSSPPQGNVFVPDVHGPGDTAATQTTATPESSQGGSDDAFVF
ncbi:lytic transglycosylase domain-containing protein [Dyella sp.]|uniref:lytic transglycosylase domain-containing protein n=1 Tax=Dyella sp. TaxID=1869338 RepID=UPI0039C897CF